MASDFDPQGREQYAAIMDSVGYMEFRAFQGEQSKRNFCCAGCPAMAENSSSPTGYWCRKIGFPDRPWGCCDEFYPFPDITKT